MPEKKRLERPGFFFEEFEVGQWLLSPGRTVTEADVVNFAALSGDWNGLHCDADHAARQPFGQRVAHGLLGMAIASGLSARMGFLEGTALAFREIADWKFSRAILLGDTIRLRAEVAQTKPMPRLGGGLVTLKVELLNQRDEVVQRGSWGVLVKSRGG